jgi:hypothetical protein
MPIHSCSLSIGCCPPGDSSSRFVNRLLIVALLLLSDFALGNDWRQETALSLRLQQLRLETKQPEQKRSDRLGGVEASYRRYRETAALTRNHEWGVSYGESLETASAFRILSTRHTIGLRERNLSHTFSLGALYSSGNDPINQPVEQTIDLDPRPFTSLQLGYVQQRELDIRNSIAWEAGISRNQQADTKIDTADGQVAWTHRPGRTWTSTLRSRIGKQMGKGLPDNSQFELAQDNLVAVSPRLSFDGGLGYNVRREGEQKAQSLLLLAALNYSTQTLFPMNEETGVRIPTPVERPELEAEQIDRGVSFLRLGCSRARDQRRNGDPFFIADRCFFITAMPLSDNQGLRLSLSRTESHDLALNNSFGRFREHAGELVYRWDHVYGASSGAERGALEAEVAAQHANVADVESLRQVYTLRYSLIF